MTDESIGTTTRGRAAGSRGWLLARVLVALAGAGLLALGAAEVLRPGGLPVQEAWWVMVVGLALAPVALALGTAWQRSALVGATLAVGFGGQLALKDPFWFQHIRVLPTAFSTVITAGFALQALVAGEALVRTGAVRQAPRVLGAFGWLRSAVLALILLLAAKSSMDFFAQDNLPRYAKQLVLAAAYLGLNLASFVALVATLPAEGLRRAAAWVDGAIALPGSEERARRLDRALPLALAALVLVVCTLMATLSFDGVPHLDDILYFFQARYFADGMLALPVPVSTEAFGHFLMDERAGRWFSVIFPGWPLALAPAVALGVPWLLNPLLAAGSVLLLHRFVRGTADRGTANLAALLLATSPWFLAASSTGLLHTFTYALVLGSWVLLLRARERPGLVLPFLAGALMGWLFLTRPLEGLYMGTLTGLWTLAFLRDRRHWRTVLAYGLGCIAVSVLVLPYDAYLTGDALASPLNAYLDRYWGPGTNDLGFGPGIGARPDWGNVDVYAGHSPAEALINAHENLYELNSDLFGWAGFSLLFALVGLLAGRWTRLLGGMAAVAAVTVGAYALYWYVGGFYTGPRYWFLVLVPAVLFTVEGLRTGAARLDAVFPGRLAPARLGGGVAVLMALGLVVFTGWLAIVKYPDINDYHDDYLQMTRDERFRDALVFVTSDSRNEFGNAFWLNDFDGASDTPLFARDLGPDTNRQVAAAYPDRPIFFVEGRSDDHPQVTVARGPLTLQDLD